jgi:hypothetical protein
MVGRLEKLEGGDGGGVVAAKWLGGESEKTWEKGDDGQSERGSWLLVEY